MEEERKYWGCQNVDAATARRFVAMAKMRQKTAAEAVAEAMTDWINKQRIAIAKGQ